MALANASALPAEARRFAVIIGAMKCGTTSMFEMLKQHPEVCAVREKDEAFFESDAAPHRVGEYVGRWKAVRPGQLLLDANVEYSKAPFISGVPDRIARSEIGAWRFIYLIREPISRIESQIRHGLYAGWGRSADEELTPDLIEFSRYAFQLDAWMRVFPRESVRVVVLEKFEAEPRSVLRGLCDFLAIDVNFDFHAPGTRYNQGSFFEAPSLIRGTAAHQGIRRVVKRIIPRPMITSARRLVSRLMTSSNASGTSDLGRWKLTDSEAAELRATLHEDVGRLQKDYGVDLDQWWPGWNLNDARPDPHDTW